MNEDIVTANARTFPLVEDLSDKSDNTSEPLFSDRDSQLEIDSLTPYVDLARMSKERYDSSPSIQHGAKMAKDRNELAYRLNKAMDNLCRRFPCATREDALTEMTRRFPALKYVFPEMNPEIQSEVAHV